MRKADIICIDLMFTMMNAFVRYADYSRDYGTNGLHLSDEVLRYTDLGMADVSKRAGFGSANNLYLTYKRGSGIASGER